MPYKKPNDSHQCSICDSVKSLNKFYIDKRRSKDDSIYVGNLCRSCIAKRCMEARKRIYGSNGAARRYQRYKVAENHINEMKEYYNEKCPLCCKRPLQTIDHCHKSGKVRGMLCTACNNALGAFGDDSDVIERLSKYFTDSNIQYILSKKPELGPSLDNSNSPGETILRKMYFDDKMSFNEMAAKLKVSVGTISSWFSRHNIIARPNSEGMKLAWEKGKFNAICECRSKEVGVRQ